ncbi:DUF6002 family protein [Amycolatopsis sp., V23-08]|uniref:DUF6002 family protein n=1 Tax=Amycolatopsis heterodermiae TaxID=3110235 RepID=A0ABU5R344_9PSEU|nr:DUF6002 family protein [Amycolatopsis sp., V23-08]MEA5360275.1 DUF6002 family protein [Amycolatopsis sp., V23-08]
MSHRFHVTTGPSDVLARHGDDLRRALVVAGENRLPSVGFQPEFALPEPSARLRDFFSVVDLPFHRLGRVGGKDLVLFDLMGNPGTRTGKTLASTVIVARAVRHIDRTGEPVVILTPSSANKATALRDAVLRAYRAGLAGPETLRIVTLVPDAARPKLWSSELTDDPALAALNPMCVLPPGHPDHVKTVALQALELYSAELYESTGARLWHTLDLANYRCADAVRAFVEQADLPPAPGRTRLHAHSVSSAFGLLGHHFGTTLLPDPPRSGYFLVQHLDTPDMVQSLHGISAPEYRLDPATGLHHQDAQPRYPATTFDPAENLETTFYTRKPATSPAMNRIIEAQGGGGIVVSLHECLAAYGRIRVLLGDAGITLPADPRSVREWSLVMVLTGVLNGIDRGLVDADEIVVHASGSYDTSDYTPIPDRSLHPVGGAADLRPAILATAGLRAPRRAA